MRQLDGLDLSANGSASDPEITRVIDRFRGADPTRERIGRVFRETFDQLYDGQRTGRYRWDDLFKTEKTHFGTLIEINLRREFDDILDDGEVLDYRVDGIELDCKYSFKFGGWMIPPEAVGRLLLVGTASDQDSEWALGVVRATAENLRGGSNRDGKKTLTRAAQGEIVWIGFGEELPPNVLLQIAPEVEQLIFAHRSGQQRINELFRQVQNQRIGRNTVATVARQDDFMKRVRANGGARSTLAKEGIIIAGGDYDSHKRVVQALGGVIPRPGEFVSLQLVQAHAFEPNWVWLDGARWRVGDREEWDGRSAPKLPSVSTEAEAI